MGRRQLTSGSKIMRAQSQSILVFEIDLIARIWSEMRMTFQVQLVLHIKTSGTPRHMEDRAYRPH